MRIKMKLILSILLTLGLVLTVVQGMTLKAKAAEPIIIRMDNGQLKIGGNDWTLYNGLLKLPEGQYKLDSDISIANTIYLKENVTLDLNGKTITANINDVVIKIDNNGILNLYDNQNDTGKITHAENYSHSGNGGGIYIGYGGTLNMYGGMITGNKSRTGGGVYNFGTFNMEGGSISNNEATGTDYSYGGGVWNGDTFAMNGGKITSNTASISGGGVYNQAGFTVTGGEIGNNHAKSGGGICTIGPLEMTGGVIRNNKAVQFSGGGVYIGYRSFNMTSGSIENNEACESGGGVGLGLGTTFSLSGGSITGNKTTSDQYGGGGGVYVIQNDTGTTTFNLSGNPVIANNQSAKTGNNVYLYNNNTEKNAVITVNDTLTCASAISVACSGSKPCTFTKGYKDKMGSQDPSDFFKSEEETTIVSLDSNGEAQIQKKSSSIITTLPQAVSNLTYSGSAQELVTAGTAEGGTMQYALGKDATTVPTEGWSGNIPTATDAMTYYVWYKAKGDASHSDSKPGVVSVTIKEKTDPHKHSIKKVDALDPTCTENGYKAHYECTECDKWFADASGSVEITDKTSFIIDATGHKWDDGVVTKEATYDETGIKTFTCENDPSHTKEEEIPRKVYYERESDTDNSDGSSGSSGGGSGKNSGSVSKQSIDVNGNTISSNHQAESGLPASDVGGNWGNNAEIWTYTKSDGTVAKAEWMNLDYNGLRYWYYFDSNGIMQTNWFDYNNERFYLMPEKDGWRGRMATGWKNIENKWYYFETVPGSSQGRLYRSTVTPDGHTVGADGAWNGVGETPVGQK